MCASHSNRCLIAAHRNAPAACALERIRRQLCVPNVFITAAAIASVSLFRSLATTLSKTFGRRFHCYCAFRESRQPPKSGGTVEGNRNSGTLQQNKTKQSRSNSNRADQIRTEPSRNEKKHAEMRTGTQIEANYRRNVEVRLPVIRRDKRA